MPERRRVNRTKQLQARYRNFRWRDHDGRPILHSTQPETISTPVIGDPKRRAKYSEIDERNKALVDRVLELSIEGKSAAEIMTELGLPDHSD